MARARGEKLRIEAVAAVPFSHEPVALESEGGEAVETPDAAPAFDPRLAEALRAAIQKHKAGRATALLGVDRGSIELMHFALPPAKDEELPELVAHQVVRESSLFVEGAAMDFLAATDDPAQPRAITAAILPQAQLARIHATCAAVGIRPYRLLLRPYASASLFARTTSPPEDVCLLVNRVADEADLTVLVRGKVVFSRTARLPGDADQETATQRLAAEINRTLAVSQESTAAEGPVEAIYIFGSPGEHQDLVDEIREEISLPSMVIDPFVAVDVASPLALENSGSFASLLGMLLDETRGGAHAIDFLHPRKPPAPKNRRRPIAMAAALATVLVLAGGYYVWDQLATVDAKNHELSDELGELKDLMKQAAKKEQLVQAIREWQATDVNWLDELRDFSLRFPSSRDAIILNMTMSPARTGGGAIQFAGLVRDPSIVVRMESNIRDKFHEIRSKRVQERQREKDYTWRFETSMSAARRDKSQYVSHLPTSPEGKVPADAGAKPQANPQTPAAKPNSSPAASKPRAATP